MTDYLSPSNEDALEVFLPKSSIKPPFDTDVAVLLGVDKGGNYIVQRAELFGGGFKVESYTEAEFDKKYSEFNNKSLLVDSALDYRESFAELPAGYLESLSDDDLKGFGENIDQDRLFPEGVKIVTTSQLARATGMIDGNEQFYSEVETVPELKDPYNEMRVAEADMKWRLGDVNDAVENFVQEHGSLGKVEVTDPQSGASDVWMLETNDEPAVRTVTYPEEQPSTLDSGIAAPVGGLGPK